MSADASRGLVGRGSSYELRVLIVEDFASDADLMVHHLRRAGIGPDVRVVQEEEPFVAALDEFGPHVVLVDNSLPRFSGRHALRLARRHDPILPVIMVTATLDERRLLRLMRVGLTEYVLKDRLETLGIAVIHAVEQAGERRRAQRDREALEASERRFRAVAEGSGDAVVIVDAEGTIVFCNGAVERVFGWKVDDLVGRHSSVLSAHGEERSMQAFFAAHGRGPLAGEEYDDLVLRPIETTLERRDGGRFPAEASTSTWTEGTRRLFAVHIRDLTHRREAEQERKLLARAVEQSRNAILITDVRGELQYVNAAFEEMTGYTRDEAIGENPRILKSGAHDSGFYEEMWRRLEAGETFQAEFANRRKNGEEYRQRSVIFPIKDEAGATVSYVGIAQDVTRERRLEEQFRQAQKMEALGQMAGGIAHDFNNVLTGILGNAELLSDGVDDPEDREHVEDIVRGATRGADLVRRLMSLSREQTSERDVVSLVTSVADVARTIRRMLPENIDVSVRHDAAADAAEAEVDEGALHQALLNLATNARDAMPDGGRLELHTAVEGDSVSVGVADTGVGMSRDVLEHLFDPFFTTKERGKGTGLGMVMVMQFAESHDGTVEVDSRPGEGTRVSLLLPRRRGVASGGAERGGAATRHGRPGPSPRPSTATTSTGRVDPAPIPPENGTTEPSKGAEATPTTVLLAEDQRQVAEVAKRALERMGLRVLMAADGAEALEILQAHRGEVELVITDLVMPRGGGVELYAQVSTWHDAPRFLVTSGYAPKEMAGARELLQEVPFLSKPWRLSEFRARVAELLNGSTS